MIIMNKIKLFFFLTLLIALLAAAGYYVAGLFSPSFSVAAFIPVPLFFWGLYSAALAYVKFPLDNGGFTKFFMGFKALKVFLSLVAALLLMFLAKDNSEVSVMAFFAFYMVMLIAESLFLVSIKKNR